jgi:hypothetical protein
MKFNDREVELSFMCGDHHYLTLVAVHEYCYKYFEKINFNNENDLNMLAIYFSKLEDLDRDVEEAKMFIENDDYTHIDNDLNKIKYQILNLVAYINEYNEFISDILKENTINHLNDNLKKIVRVNMYVNGHMNSIHKYMNGEIDDIKFTSNYNLFKDLTTSMDMLRTDLSNLTTLLDDSLHIFYDIKAKDIKSKYLKKNLKRKRKENK